MMRNTANGGFLGSQALDRVIQANSNGMYLLIMKRSYAFQSAYVIVNKRREKKKKH